MTLWAMSTRRVASFSGFSNGLPTEPVKWVYSVPMKYPALLLILSALILTGCTDSETGHASLSFSDNPQFNTPDTTGFADVGKPDGGQNDVGPTDIEGEEIADPDAVEPDGVEPDVFVPECSNDTDCVIFDDGDLCNGTYRCVDAECVVDAQSVVVCGPSPSQCHLAQCNPDTGLCSADALPDGSACDDGNPCTEEDECDAGVCTGGASQCECESDADCTEKDDDNLCNGALVCVQSQCVIDVNSIVVCPPSDEICMVQACDPTLGACVQNAADTGTACDDGDNCTSEDGCSPAGCAGKALNCNDNNLCTDDSCVDGQCSSVPNSGSCGDGNPCTVGDTCIDKTCVGTLKSCDDANACTADSCDAGTCFNVAADGACDDGNPCTGGDACSDGACVGGANTCQCRSDSDCASEEDGDLCNGTLKCVGTQCSVDPISVVVCPAPVGQCTLAVCNSATGGCSEAADTSGSDCDDGNACTTNDACAASGCSASPVVCDDNNACTDDACVEGSCVFSANSAPCDDGISCTLGDICQDSACKGFPKYCTDANPCTDDSCEDGACKNIANTASCDDGVDCTGSDQCADGSCKGGPLVCDCLTTADCAPKEDGNPCNGTFVCTNNACVVDLGTVVSCPAPEQCGKSYCEPATGECLDKTSDNGTSCDDASACSTDDVCTDGVCAGVAVGCVDEHACTVEACDPASGCTFTPKNELCDDDDPCTTDVCDLAVGCVNSPDIGASCTISNGCVSGQCQTRTTSELSCDELDWSTDGGSNDAVCGASDANLPGCSGQVVWFAAAAHCALGGARLCTIDELLAFEPGGTGCGYDSARLWSSTACGDDSYWTAPGSTGAFAHPMRCMPQGGNDASVRCCADANPAQQPVECTPAGSTCDDGIACTRETCDIDAGTCSSQTQNCLGIGCCLEENYCEFGTQSDGQCIQAFSENGTDWGDAFGNCQNLGGVLAVIRSEADNAVALAEVAEKCGAVKAHIGLTDDDEEGLFRWVTGTLPTYTNWADNEPNNSGGEDFVEMTSTGTWNDIDNSNNSCYVCSFAPDIPAGVCAYTGCP
ncbi:MAG: hypothetical protein ACI9OJ_000043 [Myxococcota bacterium]|jgi:hypothetical protein